MKSLFCYGKLREYLKSKSHDRKVTLFFDIETYQYNELEGRHIPSMFKNMTFSVAVSWITEKGIVDKVVFQNFKDFFDLMIESLNKTTLKSKGLVELIAHNTNRYDTHFLVYDVCHYYPHVKRKNMFLKNSQNNESTYKIRDLRKADKEGIILEKRVKTGNNLEIEMFLQGLHIKTTDNWMKTHCSLKMIGEKLLKLNLIKRDELKTNFDYLKWNLDKNLEDNEARDYAKYIFEHLTEKDFKYIENDVILLAKCYQYYDVIFKDFDYSKMTFTSNILDTFNTNDLASFQLLNQVGERKDRIKIKYTDYFFGEDNLYDYIKTFYKGGLNFYNDKYIGRILYGRFFSMDLNSSYPYVMHGKKLPTFLKDYDIFEKGTKITLDVYNYDEFSLFRMDKNTFNIDILAKIKSKVLKKIFTKYYQSKDYVNINSNTIRILADICRIDIKELEVLSYITFETMDFGSKEQVEKNYFIKTQGKIENKIIMNTPYDIKITDEINTDTFSEEEVYIAKVLNNGAYGIPALRAYFNLYKLLEDNSLESIHNGYANTERNILFSVSITSWALYNLLYPLKYLTYEEIDKYLVYTDTDSLYMSMKIRHKIPNELFDEHALGKWGLEQKPHIKIIKMYILNHKKYCYLLKNMITKETKIVLKCGGISHDAFDRNMEFERFIDTQFKKGIEVYNNKSIYNRQGTISIYESTTKLDIGKEYPLYFTKDQDKKIQDMFEQIKADMTNDEELSDIMYIESSLGNFSYADLHPVKNTTINKTDMAMLKILHQRVKNFIEYNKREAE